MHDRLSYERSSQEFLAEEHAAAKAALQRAGCELRVLAASLTASELESEVLTPTRTLSLTPTLTLALALTLTRQRAAPGHPRRGAVFAALGSDAG